MNPELKDFTEAEDIFISYCFKNYIESLDIPNTYFQNQKLKTIHNCFLYVIEKNLKYDRAILLQVIKSKSSLSEADINVIEKKYSNFDNIEFYKKIIKQTYQKKKVISDIQVIGDYYSERGILDDEKVRGLIDSLNEGIDDSESSEVLTGSDLAKEYESIMNKIDAGVSKRNYGLMELDKRMANPACAGEISLLVALKGSGKSLFCKNIESALINKGVPVVSFNLEMEVEPNLHRLLAIRLGIPIQILQSPNKDRALRGKINAEIEKIKRLKNYLYFNTPKLSVKDLSTYLYKAKREFKKNGVLQDDEYMFVTIDTVDLMDEFGDSESSYNIKKAINNLHRVIRKHKVHCFALVQANENKLRNKATHFKSIEDVDRFQINIEDIEGGSSYSARARVVFSMYRPKLMKQMYFPMLEKEWKDDSDLLMFKLIKANNEPRLFYLKYILSDDIRVYPYRDTNESADKGDDKNETEKSEGTNTTKN